jgi:hypothetical protein
MYTLILNKERVIQSKDLKRVGFGIPRKEKRGSTTVIMPRLQYRFQKQVIIIAKYFNSVIRLIAPYDRTEVSISFQTDQACLNKCNNFIKWAVQ